MKFNIQPRGAKFCVPLALPQTVHLCQNKREGHLHSGFFMASLFSHIFMMKLSLRVGLWASWCPLLRLVWLGVHGDILIFCADTLLSPEDPVCLSHPWFLYNLAVQLHSSDFPISYRFEISDFNKHLLHFTSNEDFSQPAGVFCPTPQLMTLSVCWWHSHVCLSTFYSSPYSCCFASHVILAFVKLKPIVLK